MRSRKFIGAILAAIAGPVAWSKPPSVDFSTELLANNPFFSATVQAKVPEGPPQYELRGVIKEKDGYLLNVYDVALGKSAWVKERDSEGELVLRSYDPVGRVAALEKQGRRFFVTARSPGLGRGVRAATSELIALRASSTPVAVAVAPPADEVRRMELTANEVRLRREERRKAGRPGET